MRAVPRQGNLAATVSVFSRSSAQPADRTLVPVCGRELAVVGGRWHAAGSDRAASGRGGRGGAGKTPPWRGQRLSTRASAPARKAAGRLGSSSTWVESSISLSTSSAGATITGPSTCRRRSCPAGRSGRAFSPLPCALPGHYKSSEFCSSHSARSSLLGDQPRAQEVIARAALGVLVKSRRHRLVTLLDREHPITTDP